MTKKWYIAVYSAIAGLGLLCIGVVVISSALSSDVNEPVVTSSASSTVGVARTSSGEVAQTSSKPTVELKPIPSTTKPAPPNDLRYATCKEAIAHGYGPYYKGTDPEYYWYRDGDSDGVACE